MRDPTASGSFPFLPQDTPCLHQITSMTLLLPQGGRSVPESGLGPLDSSVPLVHLCSPTVPAWYLLGHPKYQLNSMKERKEAGKEEAQARWLDGEGCPWPPTASIPSA